VGQVSVVEEGVEDGVGGEEVWRSGSAWHVVEGEWTAGGEVLDM